MAEIEITKNRKNSATASALGPWGENRWRIIVFIAQMHSVQNGFSLKRQAPFWSREPLP